MRGSTADLTTARHSFESTQAAAYTAQRMMPGSQENTPQKTEAAAVVQEREDIFVENADLHAEVVAQLLDTFHLAAHCDAGVGQQFIDVGCGPGNLTLHYLLPRLPPCRRLVAVDQSPVLLKAAKEKYSHPKIEYLQLDILDDVDGFVREQGQFQRLYSFATLHWVRDQRRAMRHIEKLMAPGGECMLLFKWTAHFMHLYDAVTKSPRWAKYSNTAFFITTQFPHS
ncbi:juvenile hormone acid O-methyltransferase-like isoform X4 [Amblyomma americanum]